MSQRFGSRRSKGCVGTVVSNLSYRSSRDRDAVTFKFACDPTDMLVLCCETAAVASEATCVDI